MAGRFLVASDIHLHLWTYGNPLDRIADQMNAIAQVLTLARGRIYDGLLFCGDLFHTQGNVHTLILDHIWNTFKHYGVPRQKIVFLPGNHDMVYRNNSNRHALGFLEQFGQVASDTNSQVFNVANLPEIYALPYVENADTLQRFLGSVPAGALVMLHQGVGGVEVQSRGFVMNELLRPDMVPDYVFHAFAGHYHSFHRTSASLTIPGALMQHHFGDAGQTRGVLDIQFDDKSIHIEQLPLGGKQFVDIPFTEMSEVRDICEERRHTFLRIVDVPGSRLAELQGVMETLRLEHQPKVVPKADEALPVKAGLRDVEDLPRLLARYAEINQISPELLATGHEVMKADDAVH